MALAERTMQTTVAGPKLDHLLATLPKADRAWLWEHLTARDAFGGYVYSADALSIELTDEGPETAVGRTAIKDWRRKHPNA